MDLWILSPLLVDNGTIGNVGSEVTSLPKANLSQQDLKIPLRQDDLATAYLEVDLLRAGGTVQEWDAIVVAGSNATKWSNLLTYSNDFSQANWSKTRLSSALNDSTTPDPDGGIRAEKVVEDTNGGTHQLVQGISGLTLKGGSATALLWAKENGRDIRIRIGVDSGGSTVSADFDLTSGALSATSIGGSDLSLNTAAVVESRGSWHLLRLTVDVDASGDDPQLSLGLINSGVSYTGDGSSGLWIYGTDFSLLDSPPSADSIKITEAVPAGTWRVRAHTTQGGLTGTPDYDSGALSLLPQPGDMPDLEWVHSIHVPSSSQRLRHLRIDIDDSSNADGFFDVGRVFVGKRINLSSLAQISGAGIPTWVQREKRRVRMIGGRVLFSGSTAEADVQEWNRLLFNRGSNGSGRRMSVGGHAVDRLPVDVFAVFDPTTGSDYLVERGFQASIDGKSARVLAPSVYDAQFTLEEL